MVSKIVVVFFSLPSPPTPLQQNIVALVARSREISSAHKRGGGNWVRRVSEGGSRDIHGK